jgi:predicted RNA-binding Zn-ribbon protein involved in translation (DUF1610 family)
MVLVQSYGEVAEGAEPECPRCSATLESDGTYGRGFTCPNCNDGTVYRIEGGVLNGYSDEPGTSSERLCPFCESSLSGGDSYLPWEDGSNSHAYIICPSCKQKVTLDGFG